MVAWRGGEAWLNPVVTEFDALNLGKHRHTEDWQDTD